MILFLANELSKIDNGLSLDVKYDGKFITLSVRSDVVGEMYSFTCTDCKEAYDKAYEYCKALNDPDRFEKLFDSICNEPILV